MLKPFTVWITTNWKILPETGIPDHLTWETCMWVKKQQLEPYMEQLTGLKLGKEYDKAVYCHPACLTYIQSISCEVLGWMNYKVESRLPGGNINYLRYADDTTLMTESEKELRHSKPLLTWDLESRGWYNGKRAATVVENIVSQYTLLPVSCVILGKSLHLSGPWISILNNNEEWKSCLETQHSKH